MFFDHNGVMQILNYQPVQVYLRCTSLVVLLTFSCVFAAGTMIGLQQFAMWIGDYPLSAVCTFNAWFVAVLHLVLIVLSVPAEAISVLHGR